MASASAHQRHGRKIDETPREPDLKIGLADMPRFRAGEASAAFDRRSQSRSQRTWPGTVSRHALDPQSINSILKQRAVMAGRLGF